MSTPSLYGGDGLVRPVNAPAGQQVLPGIQPGVSGGIVLATYVIIFGANGGMFVYNGSPGPGNPPVFSVSNATSDPYGNAIAPGIWAGPFGGTQAGLEYNGVAGQLLFPVAGTSPLLVGGVSGVPAGGGGGSEVQIFSPQDSGAGNNDRVFMVFAGHLGVGPSAAYFLDYLDANGTTWVQVQGGNAGLFLSTVTNLTAVLPGTGTSSVNPAQAETWHAATLINGWAGGGNENGLFYRKIAVGDTSTQLVEVKGDIINAGGAPANSVAAVLPSAYRPSTNQNHQAAVNFPQPNNSASPPWISVAAATGNLQVTGLQAVHSTAEVFFHIFIPLGTL